MADRKNSEGFESVQDLNRAFWENWLETGVGAFQESAETASRAWGEAAEAWHSWLPKGGAGGEMPGPAHVMDTLARQGRAFLELGESVAKAGQNGDFSEWLDRWLDSVSGANVPSLGAFGLPADAFRGLAPGGAIDPSHLFSMPQLGYSREHQAAFQKLARTQLEFQQANAQYNAQLEKALRDAAARFRDKLTEAAEPGHQIGSLRALYDLWVDAAEEAFAETAFSQEFRKVYGELVNALMRSRRAYMEVAEPTMKLAGVPTRRELDDTAKQLHDLRREVAELKAALRDGQAATAPRAAPARPAAGKKTAKKAPARKKTATKKAAAKKAAAKKAARKSANGRG